MSAVQWETDPEGEWVDIAVPESTGLTTPPAIRLDTDLVERIYTTLRASQLGADMKGDL